MKHLSAFLLLRNLVAFLAFGLSVHAADAANRAQLQQLLKRFPAADTDHDGVLTEAEAKAYQAQRRQNKTREKTADETSDRIAPTYADLKYGPYANNVLDLWVAKSDRPTPLIVHIHGGGFTAGDKKGVDEKLLRDCLARGVSFMSINYRFRTDTAIQDILRDCARSIQFMRAHAKEYNLDPLRVVSYGGSAGAGSSLWLAFHPDLADPTNADPVLRESSRILAAGALNTQATYDLYEWEEKIGKFKPEWQGSNEVTAFYRVKSEDELKTPAGKRILDDTSMLRLISSDDPPVFMYSSRPDGESVDRGHLLHHPKHALAVKAACEAAGVQATAYFAEIDPHPPGDYRELLHRFLFAQLKVDPVPNNPTSASP